MGAPETVTELSRMNRSLNTPTIHELRGKDANYAQRLKKVAEDSFMTGDKLSGTTVTGATMLKYGKRGRLTEVKIPSMFVRDIPTESGSLVIIPTHTVGISELGKIIVDPEVTDSYTVVHSVPTERGYAEQYTPGEMVVDLAFTTDADNLVTVNGMNPVSLAEYSLFDAIVCEFESRVYNEQPQQQELPLSVIGFHYNTAEMERAAIDDHAMHLLRCNSCATHVLQFAATLQKTPLDDYPPVD